MSVPEQVRKQTEAVQALYDDLNKPAASPKDGETGDVKDQQGNIADSVKEPAVAPESSEQDKGNKKEDPNSETYEQRWRTAQGMFNAEVPRLTAQVQELMQRNQQLEQLISTMETAKPPVTKTAPASTLTPEELDEYGESIDIMRKVSQEVAGRYEQEIADMRATIQELRGSVVPQVQQLASNQAHSSEQNFWSGLNAAVPDWQTTNANEDFKSWLLEVDPLSGLTRQTYLDDAQRNLDVQRVASFFTSWKQNSGAAGAQPNRASSELEKQVSPGKGRSSGTPQTKEEKTYTRQDIADFFTKVRMGKFKGKEAERDAIERDIYAAQAEGRIVNA